MSAHIKIGCEAYIVKDGMILLGKRGNVFGAGTWALPGGHLEHMEQARECLAREIKEEMGIELRPTTFHFCAFTDDIETTTNTHYIHLTYHVPLNEFDPHKQEVPEVCEPDTCEMWQWFPIDAMPENIFPPHAKIFASIQSLS